MKLTPNELTLARELSRRGLVADERLRAATARVVALRLEGHAVELGRLLVDEGALAPPELEKLARALGLAPAAPAAPPGRVVRIGPYELRGLLGKGGMGTVHEAWDPSLGRAVALKTLGVAGRGASELERFRREARAVAALRHPNVVGVYAFGETPELLWLAMDLVKGSTLASVVAGPPRAPGDVAALVAKIARALAAAHAQGILHRDVKPSNVLLDERGEPRLADFGLARASGDVRRLTQDGSVVGTPFYLSPEQMLGHEATERSDIYALGVTLYELLARRLPFRSDDGAELVVKVLEHEPPPIPDAPRELVAVALRALAKRPQDRYPSAAAMADDLEAFARAGALVASPPGGATSVARRRPPRALLAGIGALVVGAALLGAREWARRREDEAKRAAEELAKKEANRPFAEALARARGADAREAWLQSYAHYNVCSTLRPSDPVVLTGLGAAEVELGMFLAAEKTLGLATSEAERARAPSEVRALAWAHLARAMADRFLIFGTAAERDPDERARLLDIARRAAAANPRDPLVIAVVARVESLLVGGEGARARLDALGTETHAAEIERSVARATLAVHEGSLDEAVRIARRLVQGTNRTQLLGAWLVFSAGQPEEGIKLLEKTATTYAQNGTIRAVYARALAKHLEYPRALDEHNVATALGCLDDLLGRRLAKAVGKDPELDSVRALLDRAWFLLEYDRGGQAALALSLARDAARRAAEGPAEDVSLDLARVLARALHENGRNTDALELLDQVLRERPADRDLLRVRMLVLLDVRQWSGALACAEQILPHAPEDRRVIRGRLRALAELGRSDEAIRWADELSAVRPRGDELATLVAFCARVDAGLYADALALLRDRPPATSASPALLDLASLAERLARPPLDAGDPVAGDEGQDLGEPPESDWGAEAPYELSTQVAVERDPRRRRFGRASVRVMIRGTDGRFALGARPGKAWDLSRARSVTFHVLAEATRGPEPIGRPIALALEMRPEGGSAPRTLRVDALELAPGWTRVVLPLTDADREALARARVGAFSVSVGRLPESGAILWVDGFSFE